MKPENPQIQGWINSGHAADVILGVAGYRVASYTFAGEQDRILVIRELLAWSDVNRQAAAAAGWLVDAVDRAIDEGLVADAFDIAWCYIVTSEQAGSTLPMDAPRILSRLKDADQGGFVAEQAEAVFSYFDTIGRP